MQFIKTTPFVFNFSILPWILCTPTTIQTKFAEPSWRRVNITTPLAPSRILATHVTTLKKPDLDSINLPILLSLETDSRPNFS